MRSSLRSRAGWICGAASLLVLVACFAIGWNFTQTAITEKNGQRLKPGITLAEAEVILGGPARDDLGGSIGPATGGSVASMLFERVKESPFHRSMYRWRSEYYHAPTSILTREWLSSQAWIEVQVDAAGRVVAVQVRPVERRTTYGIGSWRF